MTSTLLRGGVHSTLGYTETLMYGHYSNLRKFAKEEAQRLKETERYKTSSSPLDCPRCGGRCRLWCNILFSRNAQDLVFLTLLGFCVALISFIIDVIVDRFMMVQRAMQEWTSFNTFLQYICWLFHFLVLICFSTGFTHIVGPTSTGSGIPEVKTIMKGVVLKEYLTAKTLIAKVVGLTASLSSGLPLGKAGPFVHVASMTATQLAKLFPIFRTDDEGREARVIALLTAASAVGISCVFACPIGGPFLGIRLVDFFFHAMVSDFKFSDSEVVPNKNSDKKDRRVLFSIEVTAIYFAVRNYWRGFYSSICGALMFRLLAIWFQDQETLTAVFKTTLRTDIPYDILELFAFLMLGVLCGVFGAGWVFLHKSTVLFIRRQKRLSALLRKNRFIYPCFVTFCVASMLFPGGFGAYSAGGLTLREAVNQFFDNRTWSGDKPPVDYEEARLFETWRGPWNNAPLTILMFFVNRFWMCGIATTLPVPCGIFIPSFCLGASFGRLMGEIMAILFPAGIRGKLIMPGAYSIIGAATFSGAVTHTLSPAIIAFEVSGQFNHVLPCVLAAMVANATAYYIQPSLYDAMIFIKKLPFLPSSINPDDCNAHQQCAEDFMNKDIHYLTLQSTYSEALDLLENHSCRVYALIDNIENKTLLGGIRRTELKRIIIRQLSDRNRVEYFTAVTAPPMSVQSSPQNPSTSQDNVKQQRSYSTTVAPYQNQEKRGSSVGGSRFSISRVVDENSNQDQGAKRTTSTSSMPMVGQTVPLAKLEEDNLPGVKRQESAYSAEKKQTRPTEMDWEEYELQKKIKYEECEVDPAPFNIGYRTSLYRTHALFSLLNLNSVFITDSGHLVGTVSFAELRVAIQGEVNRLPAVKPAPQHTARYRKKNEKEKLPLEEKVPLEEPKVESKS